MMKSEGLIFVQLCMNSNCLCHSFYCHENNMNGTDSNIFKKVMNAFIPFLDML